MSRTRRAAVAAWNMAQSCRDPFLLDGVLDPEASCREQPPPQPPITPFPRQCPHRTSLPHPRFPPYRFPSPERPATNDEPSLPPRRCSGQALSEAEGSREIPDTRYELRTPPTYPLSPVTDRLWPIVSSPPHKCSPTCRFPLAAFRLPLFPLVSLRPRPRRDMTYQIRDTRYEIRILPVLDVATYL